jgi:hypothetical protein
MRIVAAHGDIYVEEFEPRPVVMHEGTVNQRVQQVRVSGVWGDIVIDHYSDGSMIATAIAKSLGRRSTATPLEIRHSGH